MRGFVCRQRRAFTMVELLVIITLLSLVAFLMYPRLSERHSPPELLLQRALLDLSEQVSGYSGIRLAVDEKGSIVAEAMVPDEDEKLQWKKMENRWLSFRGTWKASTEHLYLFPDGTCTPWILEYREKDSTEKFFITVTATVYRGSPSE